MSNIIEEHVGRANADGAEPVAPGIWRAQGTAHGYRIVTGATSLVVDTGLPGPETRRIHEQLSAVDPEPFGHLVLTHAHEDHMGGYGYWQKKHPDIEIVTHRETLVRDRQYARLRRSRIQRSEILWGFAMGDAADRDGAADALDPFEADIIVDHSLAVTIGERAIEFLHLPGAEGPDNLGVWVPDAATLLVGDMWGPIPDAFPNLFTLRGEPYRAADAYLDTLRRVIALEPEVACPGHSDPIVGRAEIAAMLTKIHDAVEFVFEATIDGLNRGIGPLELMRSVTLPDHLQLDEQYGRVDWGVRGIWEGLTGWFRYQSTTELYDVGPAQAHADLVAMAGGADAVAERAAAHVAGGRPLDAIYLAEAALDSDPQNEAALTAKLDALDALLVTYGDRNFQEAGWLRHDRERTAAALPDQSGGSEQPE